MGETLVDIGGPDSASGFVLRVTERGGAVVHLLPTWTTIVGRSPSGVADISIHDLVAARKHCALEWHQESGRHELVVWGQNGVTLNGGAFLRANDRRLLAAGDELRIGATVLRYERVS
jgi:pSer/pThr/pTyr-binding forkhead associated (FHA) protein